MSQEIEQEELYVEHEEFGEGLILSIDEDTDLVEIQFEHGIEEIDINDLLEDDEEFEEEALDELSKPLLARYIEKSSNSLYKSGERKDLKKGLRRYAGVITAVDKLTREETLDEGRGKRGQARQATKMSMETDDYEPRGNKPAKGKYNFDRSRKMSRYYESAELVGLTLEKKPVDFAEKLNDILQARIQERIADLKINTAQAMFSPSEDGNEDA